MNKTELNINNELFYTLYEAVWNDDIKMVKNCIKLKANLNAHNEREWDETPLHCGSSMEPNRNSKPFT